MAGAGASERKRRRNIDDEVDLIAQRIMSEIEVASYKELSDVRYAKKILRTADINYIAGKRVQPDPASTGTKQDIEIRAVIKALLLSTWLQRLYFIIRTFLMSLIGGVITFSFVLYYGSLTLFIAVVVGIIGFIAALIITRLFDARIDQATRRIVEALASHRSLRDFIMEHF